MDSGPLAIANIERMIPIAVASLAMRYEVRCVALVLAVNVVFRLIRVVDFNVRGRKKMNEVIRIQK